MRLSILPGHSPRPRRARRTSAAARSAAASAPGRAGRAMSSARTSCITTSRTSRSASASSRTILMAISRCLSSGEAGGSSRRKTPLRRPSLADPHANHLADPWFQRGRVLGWKAFSPSRSRAVPPQRRLDRRVARVDNREVVALARACEGTMQLPQRKKSTIELYEP